MLMGAIIPTLMHRIPSELHSYACLGRRSTKMGDLLGSPRVAPLSFDSDFFLLSFSLPAVQHARFVCTLFFFFAFFLLGSSFTLVQHACFFGLVCPKPSEIRAADLVLGAIMSWC